MSYQFHDSSNEAIRRSLENELLTLPNPFPRNPVCTKDALPAFCFGRKEEIGIIKNAIEKVATETPHKSAWLPIDGSGGTGKSTIALYVYKSAKYKKSIDLDVQHIEANYVECPADPAFLNVQNLYKRVMEDFGDIAGAYPYYIAHAFLAKFGDIILKDARIHDEFTRKFGNIWNDLARSPDYASLQDVIRKECPQFAIDFKQLLNDVDYLIRANAQVTVNFDYILLLIDLLSTDTVVRRVAYDVLMGRQLKSEDDARDLIKKLIQVLNFLFEKGCLLIIIDNLEYLPHKPESYQSLFQLLLKFRNDINNCVILTIGSTDFWRRFNSGINSSEMNMLKGIKYDEIALKNLSEEDASQILQKYIKDFWSAQKVQPQGPDFLYPFSSAAFKYLYEISDRNLRDSLKNLNQILEKFKENGQVMYIRDIFDAIHQFKPDSPKIYLFENEIIALDNYLKVYTDRNQLSRNIEVGLCACFDTIKKTIPGKLIYKVEHEPKLKTSRGEEAKPDVYLTLTADDTLQRLSYIEFQVKAYYPTNSVKLGEIKGSASLLQDGITNYLHFLTLSPLDDKIITAVEPFKEQVGRMTPLESEEACHLLLLTREFAEIFFKRAELDASLYIQLLEKVGIKVPDLFETVIRIPKAKSAEAKKTPEKPIKEEREPPKERPRTPMEKISNPALLEQKIVDILTEKKLIPKREDIIELALPFAKSVNVIQNALSALQQKKRIQYSRKKPMGWSLCE
nr:hypothetical protein [Candidatus Sigynarchaeota archaeon]